MNQQSEDKNKRIAWIASIAVHVLLLIAFVFMIAWREPNPPYPEYGIEVNFGTSDTGSGDIQPTTPATNDQQTEDNNPAPSEQVETEVEPIEETTQEQPDLPIETTEQQPAEQTPQTTTQPAPSPDKVEKSEKKNESKKTPKKVEKEVRKKEKVKSKDKPAKTPILYKKKKNKNKNGTGKSDKSSKQANHGDDTNATGDKGQKEGTLDSRTLYGKHGGGGGAPALNMSGWMWDFTPKPKDTSDENGRIVFEVKIDNEGEIIAVKTLESSVSASVVKIYRHEIEKLTFSKTSDNHHTATTSTGTITFVIKSK